ncbi:hypothetical protein C0J52_16717 [Blattella germanica]|nr:hypothetical protein C0J52_16717 [Blattella germanica]
MGCGNIATIILPHCSYATHYIILPLITFCFHVYGIFRSFYKLCKLLVKNFVNVVNYE